MQLFDVRTLAAVSGRIRKSDGSLVNRQLGYTVPAHRLRTWSQLTAAQQAEIRSGLELEARRRIEWAISKDPTLASQRAIWTRNIDREVSDQIDSWREKNDL